MVGGGGIFFNIDPSKKRWINDIDENLISVYVALRDNPEEFIEKCREIEPHKSSELLPPPRYNDRLKKIFDDIANDDAACQALRYFIINRLGWAGRVRYDIKSRLYFSNYNGWNIVKTNKLENAAEILRDVKITCKTYEDLLYADGKDVFIYIDPPYYKNTLLANSSKLYRHNFSIDDHIKLAENIKKCQHMILISYDNDDFIKSLYDGFYIEEISWTYSGTSSAPGASKTKKKGQELLITNYEVK